MEPAPAPQPEAPTLPPIFLTPRSRKASPSSKSSAVATPSRVRPSCTIVKATSGWIPTMTVSAPRSRIMWAMSRSVREAKESITSMAVTSTITPRDRYLPTIRTSAFLSSSNSASVSADCTLAIRYGPCLRIGTATVGPLSFGWYDLLDRADLVAQESFGFLDAALQVPDGVHLGQVDSDVHQGLRDLGGEARDDDRSAEESRGLDRQDEMVRHVGVHRGDPGDVDDDDPGPVRPDAAQQLLGELAGPLGIDDSDDRQNQKTLPHLQDRRRQLADRLLLLADGALALLHEADGHGDGDAVGGGFVRVQDSVELVKVGVIPAEQRPRQHVAEQQHDADDLVRLHAPRNDALGQVPGVGLQRLERPGLEGLDIVVVYRGRLGEDLFLRHRRQQLRLGDALRPLLSQLGPVLPQVRHELAQERRGRFCLHLFQIHLIASPLHRKTSSRGRRRWPEDR